MRRRRKASGAASAGPVITPERVEMARALAAQGLARVHIAFRLGVNPGTLSTALSTFGDGDRVTLTADEQALFRQMALDGASLPELAVALDISLNAARLHLNSALSAAEEGCRKASLARRRDEEMRAARVVWPTHERQVVALFAGAPPARAAQAVRIFTAALQVPAVPSCRADGGEGGRVRFGRECAAHLAMLIAFAPRPRYRDDPRAAAPEPRGAFSRVGADVSLVG